MNQHVPSGGAEASSNQIASTHARLLGGKLQDLATGFYPPAAQKTLRRFSAESRCSRSSSLSIWRCRLRV